MHAPAGPPARAALMNPALCRSRYSPHALSHRETHLYLLRRNLTVRLGPERKSMPDMFSLDAGHLAGIRFLSIIVDGFSSFSATSLSSMLGSVINTRHLRVSGECSIFIRLVLGNTKRSLATLELDRCDAEPQDLSDMAGISIRDLRLSRCNSNVRFLLGPDVSRTLGGLDGEFSSDDYVSSIRAPMRDAVTSCICPRLTPLVTNIAPSTPSIALDSSLISKVEDTLGTHNDITSLAWPDGFVALAQARSFQSRTFVAEATFTVVPITKDAVIEGEVTLVDREDVASSASWLGNEQPNCWKHMAVAIIFGCYYRHRNNDIAYKSSHPATTFESSTDTFDYPYDTTLGPTGGSNIDAAHTNVFYIINKVYD
ncbi:hypothetical protein IW261DRAFT_1612992 [Armillaria novae-zelandiae]|uniref:Extracellular metalloproteinase n=1 Tax=Armillaria novae-zelandiae TaxID=153914 RepID=A0AA39NKY6_9AGAR|nr:hypothetical protein IW261DRAFT_1612992 [Armillaria novae-zelandiae]